MKKLNLKREVVGDLEGIIDRLTESLKTIGFGILTRIDFHKKIKEKLNKDIPPTVILGACNPQIAFEAFQINTDVTSLIPCNAVVRETSRGKCSVEIASASTLLSFLEGTEALSAQAESIDSALLKVLEAL